MFISSGFSKITKLIQGMQFTPLMMMMMMIMMLVVVVMVVVWYTFHFLEWFHTIDFS